MWPWCKEIVWQTLKDTRSRVYNSVYTFAARMYFRNGSLSRLNINSSTGLLSKCTSSICLGWSMIFVRASDLFENTRFLINCHLHQQKKKKNLSSVHVFFFCYVEGLSLVSKCNDVLKKKTNTTVRSPMVDCHVCQISSLIELRQHLKQ